MNEMSLVVAILWLGPFVLYGAALLVLTAWLWSVLYAHNEPMRDLPDDKDDWMGRAA